MMRSLSSSSLVEDGVSEGPIPGLVSRSASSVSSSSTSTPASASPPSPTSSKRAINLRQRRDGSSLEISSSPPSSVSVPSSGESRLMSRFLLGPHHFDPTPPILPVARVRKESDFDVGKPPLPTSEEKVTTVRSREQVVLHFMMELVMLRRDAFFIFSGIIFQWVHSVFTNVAYYYHAQLTAAQRVPLQDVFFDVLPEMTGSWWIASEFFFLGLLIITIASIVSILFVRWAAPHGRPLYCIPIVRRIFLVLVVCQSLRIVSFLITTLPGPSRQCLYHVPEDMTRDEMMTGPAHDRGNPEQWSPPTTSYDIIWRMDATHGCGDLMFSSHTIFTSMFVCLTFTYFNWKFLKLIMVALQIMIIPFILAAHKHYSVDVFTALYVTPLVFEILRLKFPDKDILSTDMARHYGLRFYLARGASSYVVAMWGKEFYVEPEDLPVDMQDAFYNKSSKRSLKGRITDIDATPSELDPMIV